MSATWAEIAERCEKATGPDREIDASVMRALGAEVWSYHDNCHIDAQIRNGLWEGQREDHPDFYPEGDTSLTWRWRVDGPQDRIKIGDVQPFTASVDAVLALIAEELPGWEVTLSIPGAHGKAADACLTQDRREGDRIIISGPDGYGATPALALLAAFARASVQGGQDV